MTSNVGAAELSRSNGLGFGGTEIDPGAERLLSVAKRTFKPEFLNRIDDVVIFRKLTRDDLIAIVDIEIAKLRERLKERSLDMEISQDAKAFIVDKGNATEYGARPLRRAVERYLEDPLSEALLRGDLEKASGVKVTAGKEALILTPVLPGTKKRSPRNGAGKKKQN